MQFKHVFMIWAEKCIAYIYNWCLLKRAWFEYSGMHTQYCVITESVFEIVWAEKKINKIFMELMENPNWIMLSLSFNAASNEMSQSTLVYDILFIIFIGLNSGYYCGKESSILSAMFCLNAGPSLHCIFLGDFRIIMYSNWLV